MKTYNILLSTVKSVNVQIVAESPQKAREIALNRFKNHEIELVAADVDIFISEVGAANVADGVSIFWDDLTPTKQAEILSVFGDNRNYDVFPVAEIPFDNEEDLE